MSGSSRTTNRFARWSNSSRVVGWFLVLAAVGCAFGTYYSLEQATALKDQGVRTQAEVIDVHRARDSYVVLRFHDAQGDEVVAEVGNYRWDPEPRIGDRPTIIYDPENPDGNVADARMGPDFLAPAFFGAGALIAGALVWPTFTGRLDWNTLA